MRKFRFFNGFKIIALLLFLLLNMNFQKHEEYYSLTNIKYVPAEKSVQVTLRFFSNDFEAALNQFYDQKTELNTEREVKNANELIAGYLHEKFELKFNDNIASYELLGKEFEKDAVYIYLEINEIDSLKSLTIRNTALFELYPVQEHITKIFTPAKNETVVLYAHLPEKQLFF